MVWRVIFRYFAIKNHDRLVDKLADSKPIRTAARYTVYILSKIGTESGSHKIPSTVTEFFKQLTKILRTNFKQQIEQSKKDPKEK